MAFLNVVAWIFLILSIIVYSINMITEKSIGNRFGNLILLLGYIGTLIAYINK